MRRLALITLVSAAATLGGAAAATAAPRVIGPDEYFLAQVNASSTTASPAIAVACVAGSSTGTPLPNQSAEVSYLAPPPELPPQIGFTGDAHRVGATLIYSFGTITVAAPLGTFRRYDDPLPIPTTLTVPCSGTGEVDFSPAGGGPKAITATVQVTFARIEVDPPAAA
jgi:hypothetical protein